MPLSDQVVLRFLDTIYEAAASPALWPRFLENLKTAASANKAFFILNSAGRCDLSLQTGFDEVAVRAYETHYMNCDVLLHGYLERAKLHGDWVGNQHSVIELDVFRKTEVYNDFMRPNGEAHQCGVTLSGISGMSGGIGMLRAEAQGEFGQDTIGLLAVLAPHVKRAFGMHRMLSALRSENADLRCSIESVGLAMVSVDGEGRVIRLTEPARRLLEARDGLEMVEGRLVASVAKEAVGLNGLIVGAAATGSGGGTVRTLRVERGSSPQATGQWSAHAGGAMLVSRRLPKRPLQVVVSPFRSAEMLVEERPAAMVFVNDPNAQPASRAVVMRELYGLSPTEGRLVDLLVSGVDVAEIAERLLISQQTVRFYLKSIFKKMGARRQSEVLRLVFGLPGV
jgi:DNA-binding CsgD family transcriptional regulator